MARLGVFIRGRSRVPSARASREFAVGAKQRVSGIERFHSFRQPDPPMNRRYLKDTPQPRSGRVQRLTEEFPPSKLRAATSCWLLRISRRQSSGTGQKRNRPSTARASFPSLRACTSTRHCDASAAPRISMSYEHSSRSLFTRRGSPLRDSSHRRNAKEASASIAGSN